MTGLTEQLANVQPGEFVQHRGTRRWGEVLNVKPQRDGSFEFEVQPEEPLAGMANDPTWWASYNISAVGVQS